MNPILKVLLLLECVGWLITFMHYIHQAKQMEEFQLVGWLHILFCASFAVFWPLTFIWRVVKYSKEV